MSFAPNIQISSTAGEVYRVQLLFFGSFSFERSMDIVANGIQMADNFTVEVDPTTFNADHTIYQFDVLANDDQIEIILGSGSIADGNPFVQALVVTGPLTQTESIFLGSKQTFAGADSSMMIDHLSLTPSTRGASFGFGGETMIDGVPFTNQNGQMGISWSGTNTTSNQVPDSGDDGLNSVLASGMSNVSNIDIEATPGKTYEIQLLFFGSFSFERSMDIIVDGAMHAKNFIVNVDEPTFDADHTIYNFNVLADTDGIDIDLFFGELGDGNPYVQGVVVTEVIPGDVNRDSAINLLDVAPFVEALSNGTCEPAADVNLDGSVNLLDVDSFIELLIGS
jgi:hypothetical protein